MTKQQLFKQRLSILLLIVSLALLLTAIKTAAQTIKLGTGTNPDPPFVNADFKKSEQFPGITIDLLRKIEKRLDIKIEIIQKPWARVNEDIRFNRLDGGFHFSFLPSRLSYLSFPIKNDATQPNKQYAISLRSDVLFKLKGNPISWDGSTFSKPSKDKISLGVIRGGAIATKLRGKDYDLIEVNSNSQLTELLLQKRVDGIIGLETMINARINSLPSKVRRQIESIEPAVATTHFFVAFSNNFFKEHQELVWRIWSMFDELNQDGSLETLTEKYQTRHLPTPELNADKENN